MVSETQTTRPPDGSNNDTADRVRAAATREADSAREEASRAGQSVRSEASRLASGAKQKAMEQAEAGKSIAAENLNDFTAAVRKASEELGERDQSMAANLVREAASGLEQVAGAIQGKSVQELTRSVAGFARRQPAAFLIGAALAGVALGRFARASSEHDRDDDGYGSPSRDRYRASSDGYGYGDRRYGSERYGSSASASDRSYGTARSGAEGSFGGAASGSATTASRPAVSSAGLAGMTSEPGPSGTGLSDSMTDRPGGDNVR